MPEIITFFSLCVSLFVHLGDARGLVDNRASFLTQKLFDRLKENALSGKSLVGMDSSTRFGEFLRQSSCGPLQWSRITGAMTDIRSVCNQNGGIYGIDGAYIVGEFFEKNGHRDEKRVLESREQVRRHMRSIFSRGGIVTIHHHMDNPIDGSNYLGGPKELWQIASPHACKNNPILRNLARCGAAHSRYRAKMDLMTSFLKSVIVKSKTVPVIYRPFHENNGNWFWWSPSGSNRRAYSESLKAVWEWTVNYVHNTHNHHSVLWAYSPVGGLKGGLTTSNFWDMAPKLSHLDVIGYDRYGDFAGAAADGIREIQVIVKLAEKHGKIPAITEIGHNTQGDRNMWPPQIWTKHMLGRIKEDPVATRVAWMLLWYNHPRENSCGGTYYGPHPFHGNAKDFRKVCARGDIILEGDKKFYQ